MRDELYELSQRVSRGEVTLDYALTEARALPAKMDFDEGGILPLADAAMKDAIAGHAKQPAVQWRLVLEALDHARTTSHRAAIRPATEAWVAISKALLFETPDGRVLADARRRGEAYAAQLASEGDARGAGHFLFIVGAMILDPYIERRDAVNYNLQWADWISSGLDNPLQLLLPGEISMPAPLTAFADAARVLERSTSLRAGPERGRSLKALAEALIWHELVGGGSHQSRIEECVIEALRLLPPNEDMTAREQLQTYARQRGLRIPESRDVLASACQTHETLQRMALEDPRGFIFEVTRRADQSSDPSEAIAWLLRGIRVAADRSDETARIQLAQGVAEAAVRKFKFKRLVPGSRLWSRVLSTGYRLIRQAAGRDWEWERKKLLQRASTGVWTSDDIAAAFLGLALVTARYDREDVGLQFINDALSQNLSNAAELREALRALSAELAWRMASNHARRQEWETAFCGYLEAMTTSIATRFPELTRRTFGRAEHALSNIRHPGTPSVVATAARALPRVQAELSDMQARVADAWRQMIWNATFESNAAEAVILGLQAAKGASLTIARYGHQGRNIFNVPAVMKAFSNWSTKAREFGITTPPSAEQQERLLLMPVDNAQSAGATTAEQLRNLARRFDQTLIAELARDVPAKERLFLTADELAAHLPEGTVLVSLWFSKSDRFADGVVTMLATRDGVKVHGVRTNDGLAALMKQDGVKIDGSSLLVSELRSRLQDVAASEDQVSNLLEELYTYAFQGIEDELTDLHRRGYRHLCVNPYGMFHFCPIPLLGRKGRHLADDWVVTHLPAVGLLRPLQTSPALPCRRGAAMFGLGFADGRYGLEALPTAVEEARCIADAVGGDVFLDTDGTATATQFANALREKRFVHVASHGHQDAYAPALQTLYFLDDESHDGRYRAFEALRDPLVGLDLVTLSACETALGRIDYNDNTRGLQAFLFAAGASTIVSCLWPVVDEVAAFFFQRFYEELSLGRKKVDAFEKAQRAVRERFPAYGDWGTFQYSGAW